MLSFTTLFPSKVHCNKGAADINSSNSSSDSKGSEIQIQHMGGILETTHCEWQTEVWFIIWKWVAMQGKGTEISTN